MNEQIPVVLNDAAVRATQSKLNWPAYIVAAARPHQWTKNLFIFAPLLFAGLLTDSAALGRSFLAFGAFCLLSSSLYIFNDWSDLEEDRAHPEKRHRPLASGQLPVSTALAAAGLLATTAFFISYSLGLYFFLVTLLYFGLVLAYCLGLKKMLVLDCMIIALGFVLRVVGGAVAISVTASHWLIVCAFLLALFLAFSKRRQELIALSTEAGSHRSVLKFYTVGYLGQVNIVLVAASIVCYALYTVAPETVDKFHTDALIYGTVFVIYGMLRYLALIEDPKYGGNPSKLLIDDKPLLLTLVLWGVYNAAIIYYETYHSLIPGQ